MNEVVFVVSTQCRVDTSPAVAPEILAKSARV
jgi:hypothetical protein